MAHCTCLGCTNWPWVVFGSSQLVLCQRKIGSGTLVHVVSLEISSLGVVAAFAVEQVAVKAHITVGVEDLGNMVVVAGREPHI